jgi:hypothetical protein
MVMVDSHVEECIHQEQGLFSMQQSPPDTKRKQKLVKIRLQKIASPQPPPSASGVVGSENPCPQCGRENVSVAKFCTNCGNQLHQQQVPEQPSLHLHPYVQPRLSYPALIQPAPRRKKPWYRSSLSSDHAYKRAVAPRFPSLVGEEEKEKRRKLLEEIRKQRHQQEQERRKRQQRAYSTSEEYREYQKLLKEEAKLYR